MNLLLWGSGCLNAWLRYLLSSLWLPVLGLFLRPPESGQLAPIVMGLLNRKLVPWKKEKEKELHVSANFPGREQLSDAGRAIVIALWLTLTKLSA